MWMSNMCYIFYWRPRHIPIENNHRFFALLRHMVHINITVFGKWRAKCPWESMNHWAPIQNMTNMVCEIFSFIISKRSSRICKARLLRLSWLPDASNKEDETVLNAYSNTCDIKSPSLVAAVISLWKRSCWAILGGPIIISFDAQLFFTFFWNFNVRTALPAWLLLCSCIFAVCQQNKHLSLKPKESLPDLRTI